MTFVASSLLVSLILVCQLGANEVQFGSGDTAFSIEFVEVGSPGNRPDVDGRMLRPTTPTGSGSVDYVYEISKHEVSCEIANVLVKRNAFRGIPADSIGFCPLAPSSAIPFFTSRDRTREFVNWLNVDQGFEPTYTLDPTQPVIRNPKAKYFVSTADEWYKAAFYDPEKDVYYDYATGSDEVPTYTSGGTDSGTAVTWREFPLENHLVDVELAGGESPFGTVGQTGNGSEHEELSGLYNVGVEGFQFSAWQGRKLDQSGFHTFRVVAIQPVPEPSHGILSLAFAAILALRMRNSRRS